MRGALGFLLLGLTLLAGCPHTQSGDLAVAHAPAQDSSLALGPRDVFEVRVFDEQELSGKYQVDADGTINYPLVGRLRVEGLDAHQIESLLAERLSEKYLRNPQVSILIVDQPSKKIVILGQVTKPGTFSYALDMNIVEAITLAGGFTAMASKNDVTVTRGGQKFTVPVGNIGEGKARNVLLRPGDIISVGERIF